jgi:hypothetical protein
MGFFQELEERGEIAILRALDTLNIHIQWVITGGENMISSAGNRLLNKDRSQVGDHCDDLIQINHVNNLTVLLFLGTLCSTSWLVIRYFQ